MSEDKPEKKEPVRISHLVSELIKEQRNLREQAVKVDTCEQRIIHALYEVQAIGENLVNFCSYNDGIYECVSALISVTRVDNATQRLNVRFITELE